MKTVNSVSGGQTSAYIAKNYPADYNIFALVTTDDIKCQYPDAKVRQIVSDKIGKEFIGTLEEDIIIKTILDLEQFIGTKIDWVSGKSFDEQVKRYKLNGEIKTHLPSVMRRTCTVEMKIEPIFEFWKKNIREITEDEINELSKIKSYNFDLKANDSNNFGFLAHEVANIYPMLSNGETVNYIGFIPILLAKIKMLENQINIIKQKLNV